MIKKALIVANGFKPGKSLIRSLKKYGYDFLIAADGGANNLRELNILPDLVIGDLDSILTDTLNWVKKSSEVVQIKRQNDTDVEKAIKYIIKKKCPQAIIIGGTGNRLDHSIANLSFLIKYFDKINLLLVHMDSILIPYSGYNEIKVRKGEIISLYTFKPGVEVSAKGLKYKLNKTSLMFGVKDSTSNIAVSNKISLNAENGIAFLIRGLKEVLADGNI